MVGMARSIPFLEVRDQDDDNRERHSGGENEQHLGLSILKFYMVWTPNTTGQLNGILRSDTRSSKDFLRCGGKVPKVFAATVRLTQGYCIVVHACETFARIMNLALSIVYLENL